ncbi:MAG: hypothetical protein R3C68_11470 [Myxococcota bacterium]
MRHRPRCIATRAQAMGLGIKLHVDQLRDGEGAQLAADIGALSADHLEYTSLQGRRYCRAGVVATVLPAASGQAPARWASCATPAVK